MPLDFSVTGLTAALEDIPHVPTQLFDSGLFEYSGIATTFAEIERRGTTLSLISTSARGAPGKLIGRDTRNIRRFNLAHLQINDAVYADEVQDVREFGTDNTISSLDSKVNSVLALGKSRFDYTSEWQRVGALKGQVIDADGTTVLYDFFSEYGLEQQVLDFELDVASTDVRAKVDEATNLIDDELQGVIYSGLDIWCGRNFWAKFVSHKSVRETYLNQPMAAQLQGSAGNMLDFGGATFRKYRGKANGADMIGANDCYIVPRGVPGLLLGRFGPPDWIGYTNTLGMPLYAMAEQKKKAVEIEMQSNMIHLNTRPRAIVKGTI